VSSGENTTSANYKDRGDVQLAHFSIHAEGPGHTLAATISRAKKEIPMRMPTNRLVCILVALLAISLPLPSSGQDHQRYRLYDLGPGSGIGSGITLANDHGDVVGGVRTSTTNPYSLNPNPLFGPTEFTSHAFRWRNGNLTDLGTLPGGNNSGAVAVNESGTIVGAADSGVIDPLTGYPEAFGVLWRPWTYSKSGRSGRK
jgi:hypothetical protein